MIPEKLKKLIELLTSKTQNKKAIWNKGSANNQFKLSISDGIAITVTEWPEDYNNEAAYGVTIFNDNGDPIERFDTDRETTAEDFHLLRTFHKAASDQYYKVEETMDALLNSITSQEVIGQEEKPISKASDDDDLPF